MMPQRRNKKILIYLFLLILLGTLGNKDINKLSFPKISEIEIIGLSDKDNLKLMEDFKFLVIENLFFLDKKKIENIINRNKLVEKYLIFKKYPSSLKIKIFKTEFLAYVKRDGVDFLLGSNGKYIRTNDREKKIPFVYGNFNKNDFKNLKDLIDNSNFNFKEIKNLYFFPSGRWDIETYSGILIKLPKEELKKNIDLFTIMLTDQKFEKVNLIDLRQKNQIITNDQ